MGMAFAIDSTLLNEVAYCYSLPMTVHTSIRILERRLNSMPSLPDTSHIKFLQTVPQFAGLSTTDYRQLAASLQKRHYKKGEVIFHAQDPGNALFLITQGVVQAAIETADRRELIVSLLYPPEFFGEMTLLDDLSRSVTVTALEPSMLLILSKNTFMGLLERTPALALKMAEALCRRLRKATELVHSLAFLDAHGKMARVLFGLSQQRVRALEPSAYRKVRLSQNELAKLTGLSRETVGRVLRDFQQAGYVHLHRSVITVLEPAMLAELSHT